MAPAAEGPLATMRRLAISIGPGVVVMLADTDAGSVITAAQSGAEWGYRLVLPQLIAIPILFAMQELTIRLGLSSGLGLAELIRRRYGRLATLLALAALAISCFGALVTQLSALAGLADSFGVSPRLVVGATVMFFIAVVTLGAYASVERVAILAGLFELAFLVVAWRAGPDFRQFSRDAADVPLANSSYLYLLAANIGTTFMPWAAFYQQSAMTDKGMRVEQLPGARLETLAGAILCQVVTAAIVIAGAATVARTGGDGGAGFGSIAEIAGTFTRTLGPVFGRGVFTFGLIGSALVAAIVVTLTVAWAIGETLGLEHSLERHPREAPWFYVAFVALLNLGGLLVVSGVDPLRVSIGVGVVNAVLLPVVLGFLYFLAIAELRGALALSRSYAVLIGVLFALVSGVALYSGLAGAFG
ncbi:MAG: NRAMP family divalent metal transporter [Roseiarcus sp.]